MLNAECQYSNDNDSNSTTFDKSSFCQEVDSPSCLLLDLYLLDERGVKESISVATDLVLLTEHLMNKVENLYGIALNALPQHWVCKNKKLLLTIYPYVPLILGKDTCDYQKK